MTTRSIPTERIVHLPTEKKAEVTKQMASIWADSEFLQVHSIVLYYMILLLGSLWVLLDVWSGSFRLMQALGLSEQAVQQPLLRSIGYTMVGATLGNILYKIRTLYRYYLKGGSKHKYNHRWLGKYISGPWESAAMALIVFALIRGGIGLFGGPASADSTGTSNFAAFGIGALIGMGMREVVGWVGEVTRAVFVTRENGTETDETAGKDHGGEG